MSSFAITQSLEEIGLSTSSRQSADQTPTTTVSRVERKRNERVRLILAVTAELIGVHGPERISLEEVAERLDVTKGSLYHYFSSKDELVTAAIEALAHETTAKLTHVAETTAGTSTDRLRALLREQLLLVLRDYPAMMHIFLFPRDLNPEDQDRVKELRRSHHLVFKAVMDEGVASGEFVVTSPGVALQCIYAALNVAPLWVSVTSQAALERSVEEIVDTAMMMVGVRR